MEHDNLFEKINSLPDPLKKEVEDFIDFLTYKRKKDLKKKHPKAGFLKNIFIVADDFDAPLEDFKDYM